MHLKKIQNFIYHDGIEEIGGLAFQDVSLNSITLPDGLKYIRQDAFERSRITTFTIPSSVEILEKGSLSGNTVTTVINKTGRSFAWNEVLGVSGDYNFETGVVTKYNGSTITISK